MLFGIGTEHDPPDLILQDELHLISGPLGTMVGIYESAIDIMCSSAGTRPKVVGSTATIRRAGHQVRALFDRVAFQFPPSAIDSDDAFFAVKDEEAAGRTHVGVTTAGRSAKFMLQGVAASLLQSGYALPDPANRDAYWTLVAYFNSLRELGGALVLVEDDVGSSLRILGRRYGEVPRPLDALHELTSRVSQAEIRDLLDELALKAGEPGAVDVLLASNMISVGVDIPRLTTMIVNGQPKTVAEYIQATSRVGRGAHPGLIVTVYNAGRARDRARYETFVEWHSALYRDVEATSVTPWAARARDRAIHAVLVALTRGFMPEMADQPPARPRSGDGDSNRLLVRFWNAWDASTQVKRTQRDRTSDSYWIYGKGVAGSQRGGTMSSSIGVS